MASIMPIWSYLSILAHGVDIKTADAITSSHI